MLSSHLFDTHALRSSEIFSDRLLQFIHNCDSRKEDVNKEVSAIYTKLKEIAADPKSEVNEAIIRKRIENLENICVLMHINIIQSEPIKVP